MKKTKSKSKKNAAEDLMESLMDELKDSKSPDLPKDETESFTLEDTEGPSELILNTGSVSQEALIELQDVGLTIGKGDDVDLSGNILDGNSYDSTRVANYNDNSDPGTAFIGLKIKSEKMPAVPSIPDTAESVVSEYNPDEISEPVSNVLDQKFDEPGRSQVKQVDPKQLKEADRIAGIIPTNNAQVEEKITENISVISQISQIESSVSIGVGQNDKTVALQVIERTQNTNNGDRTVAVAGFSNRNDQGGHDKEKVKVSVGQSRGAFSSDYAAWGTTDSNLAHADNLKIAQEKILELEKENEKLRMQNEELISASEIVRERADILTSQVHEFKNDRDSLESSFKNEMNLLKSQLNRKENELQKSLMKVDELDSRLKFDMKKIRIRERELENRLELVRAEKNALVKSKDEQILDLRRKLDQLQLEVDSYRQKCVELNKIIDINQESFKRTTRALRLAMANLELQEENKTPLKKAE